MVSKKAIIAIVVVVVVVIIAAVAIGGGSDDKPADVRYDYTMELSDGFNEDEILPSHPDEGMQFVILHYTLANDSVEDGISTNPLIFEWTATIDGLTYDLDMMDTAAHPDESTVEIGVGAQATSVVVIEIPDTATLDDITISLDVAFADFTYEQDDSLL